MLRFITFSSSQGGMNRERAFSNIKAKKKSFFVIEKNFADKKENGLEKSFLLSFKAENFRSIKGVNYELHNEKQKVFTLNHFLMAN